MCHVKYIKGNLGRFDMSEAKAAGTPLEPGIRLTRN